MSRQRASDTSAERGAETGGQSAPTLDDSPAYDLLQSLRVVAGSAPAGHWLAWAERSRAAIGDDERRSMRVWFGGETPVGPAYIALIPRLDGARGAGEVLAGLAALPVGDFLRVAVTAGYTDPDTPLDAEGLLALAASPAQARAFVERHLRVSGRARTHLLRILAEPEAARAELLDILRRHLEGAFAEIGREAADERERAAARLHDLLAAPEHEKPDWLRKLGALRGFSPVLVVPSAFVSSSSTYYHEIRRPLFDGTAFEPYLLLVGAQRLLGEPRAGRPPAPASVGPRDPAERWAALFQVFAEPMRLRMVHLLARRPWYGQELAAELGISGATANHHINQLVRAGLVRVERRARRTYFVLQGETLREILGASGRYLLQDERDPNDVFTRDATQAERSGTQ